MANEASNAATYIVEPTNEFDGTSGYDARKQTRTTNSVTHYASAAEMCHTIGQDLGTNTNLGGLVYFKNGIYEMDDYGGAGTGMVDWGKTDSSEPDHYIRLVGETRDGVQILNTFEDFDSQVWLFRCNGHVENMTLDGGNIGTMHPLVSKNTVNPWEIGLTINNCKIRNNTNIGVVTGRTKYVVVTNSYFEVPQTGNDQCAFETSQYGYFSGNMFDRSGGVTDGYSLTSGSAYNTIIENNTCYGILMESFDVNPDYENISINHNIVIDGSIAIGAVGAYNTTFRNVVIEDNLLDGSGIKINGPNSGSYSTQIKDLFIINNKLINPTGSGIKVDFVAGYTEVIDNKIKNSNISLNATTFDKGLIYLDHATDVICENNRLFMEFNASANFSPYGINANNIVNPTIRDNRIINMTSSNPSYSGFGGFSGTQTISKSL